jgi:MinD-like ATPase involved in chromosome partitioning or flagellar assembly
MIKNHVEKRDEFATLDILCAGNPIQMEGIMPETMDWIIQALTASSYEYIIIDTSSELSVNVVKLLEIAHLVVIPVIQDVNCAWKLWMLKEILENINISMDKTKVIVNRCKKQYGFYNDEYEMELGFEILGEMKEFDASFQRQINQGKMISKQRNKQAYQSFCTMTQRMCELVNIIKK